MMPVDEWIENLPRRWTVYGVVVAIAWLLYTVVIGITVLRTAKDYGATVLWVVLPFAGLGVAWGCHERAALRKAALIGVEELQERLQFDYLFLQAGKGAMCGFAFGALFFAADSISPRETNELSGFWAMPTVASGYGAFVGLLVGLVAGADLRRRLRSSPSLMPLMSRLEVAQRTGGRGMTEAARRWIEGLPLRWALGGLVIAVVVLVSTTEGDFTGFKSLADAVSPFAKIVLPITVLAFGWGWHERRALKMAAERSLDGLQPRRLGEYHLYRQARARPVGLFSAPAWPRRTRWRSWITTSQTACRWLSREVVSGLSEDCSSASWQGPISGDACDVLRKPLRRIFRLNSSFTASRMRAVPERTPEGCAASQAG